MKSESHIIKECKKGKEASFEALYNLYKGYCYTICVRYGVETSFIKDCMQEIFSQAFQNIKKYDPNKAKFKTWLTSITINRILMHKRKQRPEHYDIDILSEAESSAASAATVESSLDHKQLLHMMRKMPEKYRMVFNLSILDGYSHAEIAEMLHISESSSRVLLHRGREWAIKQIEKTHPGHTKFAKP